MKKYEKYVELADELEQYSTVRKGEISRLTHRAAEAIDDLVGELRVSGKEEDDGK